MTDARLHTRRALIATGGLSLALLAVGRTGLALAQDDATPDEADVTDPGHMAGSDEAKVALRQRLDDFTHVWRATSPATRAGDTYALTLTNVSGIDQQVLVVTTLMDHRAHHNAAVLAEELTLAAGESSELRTTNDYGVANHFQTTVLANTGLVTDLELLVVVEDGAAVETARFTQNAFMILSIVDLRESAAAAAEERRERRRERAKNRVQRRRDRRESDDAATPTP